MSQVEIEVNGRLYKVSCEDGQEGRLGELAAHLDAHVAEIAADIGQIGDARLMLLAALTVCDEFFDARARLRSLELDSSHAGGASPDEAARVITQTARRLEAIAARL